MSSYSQFAFGHNTWDDCPCPATGAGLNPGRCPVIEIAERYDRKLSERYKSDHGTVSEDEAESVWLDVLKQFREEFPSEDSAYELGRHVAYRHHWLNRNEELV